MSVSLNWRQLESDTRCLPPWGPETTLDSGHVFSSVTSTRQPPRVMYRGMIPQTSRESCIHALRTKLSVEKQITFALSFLPSPQWFLFPFRISVASQSPCPKSSHLCDWHCLFDPEENGRVQYCKVIYLDPRKEQESPLETKIPCSSLATRIIPALRAHDNLILLREQENPAIRAGLIIKFRLGFAA